MGQLWQGIPHLPPRRGVPYWAPTLMLAWRPWRCCRQKWRPCPRWRCAYKRCFFCWRGLGRRMTWSGEIIVGQPWIGCTYMFIDFYGWMDWCCRNVCLNFEYWPTKSICFECVCQWSFQSFEHIYDFLGNVRGYVVIVVLLSSQFVWKRSSIIQSCCSTSRQI